jgi:hypothetical protein
LRLENEEIIDLGQRREKIRGYKEKIKSRIFRILETKDIQITELRAKDSNFNSESVNDPIRCFFINPMDKLLFYLGMRKYRSK